MRFLAYTILSLTIFLTGCLTKKTDSVLARFDGQTVTKTEFMDKVRNLPKNLQGLAIQRKKDFVEEMVDERFLVKEAKKRNIESQEEVREVLEAARKKIIIAKLIEIEVDRKITMEPDEALKFYESHRDEFMTPVLLRASHILVATEEEAKAVKKELQGGADFEELARSRSLDNTSIRGGDVGFFQKGQLIPGFEEAAFNLRKGEISNVVKTQFGFHVIKLTDRAEPSLRDFKLVKGIVEKQIRNEKRAKLFKEFIQKTKGNIKVEIDQQALEALTLEGIAKS